jgi:hypothetical protein
MATMIASPLSPAGGPFISKKTPATQWTQGSDTFVFTPSDDLLPHLQRKSKYTMVVYHPMGMCAPCKVMPIANGQWKVVVENVPKFKCTQHEMECSLYVLVKELGKILGRADIGLTSSLKA